MFERAGSVAPETSGKYQKGTGGGKAVRSARPPLLNILNRRELTTMRKRLRGWVRGEARFLVPLAPSSKAHRADEGNASI